MNISIGVDVGGTKIEILVLDATGTQLYRSRRFTDRTSYAAVVNTIVGMVEEAETKVGLTGSVGVGIPGTVSMKTGFVKNANSTVLNGHAIDADLSSKLQRPVVCMNDANCLALSEAVDGAGAGKNVVCGIIIGTGSGAGFAIGGHPHIGKNLVAGEWGHNPLPWMRDSEYPGPRCWCGKTSCIEKWVSGTGFEEDYHRSLKASVRTITGKDLAELAHRGDLSAGAAIEEYARSLGKESTELLRSLGTSDRTYDITSASIKHKAEDIVALSRSGEAAAVAALHRYADRLARSLAHIVNLIDPDVIVLGGGMSNVDELYELIPPLMPLYVFGEEADTPIVKSKHGDSSGVRGAAWLNRS